MLWLRFAVLVLAASILQTGLVGAIAIRSDNKPDLLLILLVFFAVRADPTDAIIASFAIGFIADLTNPAVSRLMGPRLLSFGLFGMLLSDLSSIIALRRVPHQAIAIFLMGCLTTGLSHLLTLLRAEPVAANLATGLLWQPLYSALLGPFLFLPVGWTMRMYGKGHRRPVRRPLLR